MQRAIVHDPGTFPICPDCGLEPRHIFDHRRRPVGGHLMSCRCGDSPKYDDMESALACWGRTHRVRVVPAPAAVVTPITRGLQA